MLEAPSTILASTAIGRPLAFLLFMTLLAGPVAAEPAQRGDGHRCEGAGASMPPGPFTRDPIGPPGASAPERTGGRLLAALAEARALAGGDTTPPEPPRETDPGKRRNFFRTRTGAVILIVAGAVVVGSAARNSLLGDR